MVVSNIDVVKRSSGNVETYSYSSGNAKLVSETRQVKNDSGKVIGTEPVLRVNVEQAYNAQGQKIGTKTTSVETPEQVGMSLKAERERTVIPEKTKVALDTGSQTKIVPLYESLAVQEIQRRNTPSLESREYVLSQERNQPVDYDKNLNYEVYKYQKSGELVSGGEAFGIFGKTNVAIQKPKEEKKKQGVEFGQGKFEGQGVTGSFDKSKEQLLGESAIKNIDVVKSIKSEDVIGVGREVGRQGLDILESPPKALYQVGVLAPSELIQGKPKEALKKVSSKEVITTSTIGAFVVAGEFFPVLTSVVGEGVTVYSVGKAVVKPSKENVASAIIMGGLPLVPKVFNLGEKGVKSVAGKYYEYKLNKELGGQVIVYDVPKPPSIISREVSVDIYGKPVEQFLGISVTAKNPSGTTSRGALLFELGESQLIPKDNLNFNYVVLEGLKKSEVISGVRTTTGKTNLPLVQGQLSESTGGQSSIVEPYQKIIPTGLFESLLSVKGTSARVNSEGVSITDFLPSEEKIVLTKTSVLGKTSNVPVVESTQLIGIPRGIMVEGKTFSTDIIPSKSEAFDFGNTNVYESTLSGKEVSGKARNQEVTGKLKPEITGKEVKTYDFTGGQAKQLFVFERADIMLKKYGTSENPVAESVVLDKIIPSIGASVEVKEVNKKNEFFKKKGGSFGGHGVTGSWGEQISILEPQEQKQESVKVQLESPSSLTSEEKKKRFNEQQQKQEQQQEQSSSQKQNQNINNNVFISQVQELGKIQENMVESKVRQRSRQLFGVVSLQKQDVSQNIIGVQVQKQDVVQNVVQVQKQEVVQDILSSKVSEKVIVFDNLFNKSNLGENVIEKQNKEKNIFLFNKQEKQIQSNKSGFNVLVRRYGRFESKGVFGSIQEAFSKGESITRGTLARSFKVTDLGGNVVTPSVLPRGFRKAKREGGVVVQESKFALSSVGEKSEIQFFKKNKIKGVGFGL